MVTNTLDSQNSRKAYDRALRGFFSWISTRGRQFDRRSVQEYRASLIDGGAGSSTINIALSAIRKLAEEAAECGVLNAVDANGISRVHGVAVKGFRLGRWLNAEQLKRLLELPARDTGIGKRDRVLMGLMALAGLRQEEVSGLQYQQIAYRESRMVIEDLVGKGNSLRTVPIHQWLEAAIHDWLDFAKMTSGPLLREVRKTAASEKGISCEAVRWTVDRYSARLGMKFSSHDLRRSFAQAARKGDAPLQQIQVTLGHSSVVTTERYLNTALDLEHPACDSIKL
jgi:site-specific recombinase XerC